MRVYIQSFAHRASYMHHPTHGSVNGPANGPNAARYRNYTEKKYEDAPHLTAPHRKIPLKHTQLVTASHVMTKSRAPAGGNNYPENGLVKPLRRDTQALGPAGMFAVRLLNLFAN
jgi:hypothetical protein